MKSFTLILLALAGLSRFALAAPLALVYTGPGSCPEDCSPAAAEVARQAGFAIKMVTPAEVTPENLAQAALYVQPGGHSDEVARALSEKQKEAIRHFLKHGGHYLGFCAGAFFTDTLIHKKPERGLGILPGEALIYEQPPRPHHGPGEALPMTWEGHLRYVYFEGGASFKLKKHFTGRIIATYEGGEPATIIFPYGHGRVAISGAHPEAPAWWLEDSGNHDANGPNVDLAVGMIHELFE